MRDTSRVAARTTGSPQAGRTSVRRPRIDSARREDLLQQLEDLLLAEGFTALTVDQIAARLHCSKATLYQIATTKEQLVVAVTKRFFRNAADAIESAVEAVDAPQEQIASYLNGVGAAMRRNSPAFYQDMVGYPPTADIYRRNSEAAARRVRQMIEGGVERGAFRRVDGVFAAQLVALAIDGVQSGLLLRETGMSAGDAFAELGNLLLDGLASRPRQP